MRIAWFAAEAPHSASARLRVLDPAAFCRPCPQIFSGQDVLAGRPSLDAIDLVIVQRGYPAPETRAVCERLLGSGRPVIFETDETIAALAGRAVRPALTQQRAECIAWFAAKSDLVTVSTPQLAADFGALNGRVALLPTCLSPLLWNETLPMPGRGAHGRTRLAVLGFARASAAWGAVVLDAVARVLARHDNIECIAYGWLPRALKGRREVSLIETGDNYAQHPPRLASLGIEIAIVAPSVADDAEQEALLLGLGFLGIPTLYADTPEQRALLPDGSAGLACAAVSSAWLEAIGRLLDDPDHWQRISAGARAHVRSTAMLTQQVARWSELFQSVLERRRAALVTAPATYAERCRRADEALRLGDFSGALALADRAAAESGEGPESAVLAGRALRGLRQLAAARTRLESAVLRWPSFLPIFITLGLVERDEDRLDAAAAAFETAQRLQPASFEAALNLGQIRLAQGRVDEAIALLERAAAARPQMRLARSALAAAYRAAERHADAARQFVVTAMHDPADTDAALELAESLILRNLMEEAVGVLEHCLPVCRPGLKLKVLLLLAGALVKTGEIERAQARVDAARALAPDDPEVMIVHGDVRYAADDLSAAEACYRAAVEQMPDAYATVWRLALTVGALGRYAEAEALLRQLASMNALDANADVLFAHLLLRQGRFEEGWPYHERRLAPDQQGFPGPPSAPLWDGQPLAGQRLVLLPEQGLGDEIMFASMVDEARARAPDLVLECAPRLVTLFQRSFAGVTVRAVPPEFRQPRPDADCYLPIGSLGRLFRPSRATFPRRPYLCAAPERVQHYRDRLSALGPELKVGLSWRGGVIRTRQRLRSLGLLALTPVARARPMQLVSLQYTECAAERAEFTERTGLALHHWQEAIDDYDETAALVSALDVVVSVCTAIVHLTGALGRPVLVMAPYVAEWRYGHAGEELVWYGSARVFRQPALGDWDDVIGRVCRALAEFDPDGQPPS